MHITKYPQIVTYFKFLGIFFCRENAAVITYLCTSFVNTREGNVRSVPFEITALSLLRPYVIKLTKFTWIREKCNTMSPRRQYFQTKDYQKHNCHWTNLNTLRKGQHTIGDIGVVSVEEHAIKMGPELCYRGFQYSGSQSGSFSQKKQWFYDWNAIIFMQEAQRNAMEAKNETGKVAVISSSPG